MWGMCGRSHTNKARCAEHSGRHRVTDLEWPLFIRGSTARERQSGSHRINRNHKTCPRPCTRYSTQHNSHRVSGTRAFGSLALPSLFGDWIKGVGTQLTSNHLNTKWTIKEGNRATVYRLFDGEESAERTIRFTDALRNVSSISTKEGPSARLLWWA